MAAKKELSGLLARIERAGWEVRQSRRNCHWKVYDRAGRLLAVTSATPGDYRSIRNFEHGLIRQHVLAGDRTVNPAPPPS